MSKSTTNTKNVKTWTLPSPQGTVRKRLRRCRVVARFVADQLIEWGGPSCIAEDVPFRVGKEVWVDADSIFDPPINKFLTEEGYFRGHAQSEEEFFADRGIEGYIEPCED